jgi:hypothetical protein
MKVNATKRVKKRLGRKPKHDSQMANLGLYVPVEWRDAIKQEAEARGVTASELVVALFKKEVGR